MSIASCTKNFLAGHENNWQVHFWLHVVSYGLIIWRPTGSAIKFGWWSVGQKEAMEFLIKFEWKKGKRKKTTCHGYTENGVSHVTEEHYLLKQRSVATDAMISSWSFGVPIFPGQDNQEDTRDQGWKSLCNVIAQHAGLVGQKMLSGKNYILKMKKQRNLIYKKPTQEAYLTQYNPIETQNSN